MRRNLLLLLLLLIVPLTALAQATTDFAALVEQLGRGGFAETEQAVQALGALGDPRGVKVLEALSAGDLAVRSADRKVAITVAAGGGFALTDPATGADLGQAGAREVERIRLNNSLRRAINAARGALTLLNPDPKIRQAAADSVFKSRDKSVLDIVEAAIGHETEPRIRKTLEEARAAIQLTGEAEPAAKLSAIATIAARGDRDALSLLTSVSAGDGEVVAAAAAAVKQIEQNLALWNVGQNLWYGLSLGSVLLLAAIGLAITFGVMGVINMAHGEMVMLGAYTAFVVQETVRMMAPELIGFSVLFALPAAFIVGGLAGIAIEQSVIRWLYGRPLETLLATWGLSLIIQQAVRSIFGPTNRQVIVPSWLSGAIEIGQLQITLSRLAIIIFAAIVFSALLMLLRATRFGLSMRAVTQNRPMAAAMGIRTPWVDALTFGLGSGIAGLAGVALSQIDNVSPNLGQGYIIDSFLVVVFGGVGNLWGTLLGALTLGVANKLIEPLAGAVLGKIFVLIAIILFIQRRPRGLFALKGRAVEA